MEFFTNVFFLIALTFVFYVGAQYIQRKTGLQLLNPILVSVMAMICLLSGLGIDYETYEEGGAYIDFWLKPAVVALGVPLYKQLSNIRKQLLPLLISELAGYIVGIVSVVLLAKLFGATHEVVVSLAPKSVTTPIAMEISSAVGGIPALTAAVVVCPGIFGGMAGFRIVRMSHIRSNIASSLSIGTAAHAVGTSAVMVHGERFGAFSSLGLTINGLFTALLTPFLLEMLGLGGLI